MDRSTGPEYFVWERKKICMGKGGNISVSHVVCKETQLNKIRHYLGTGKNSSIKSFFQEKDKAKVKITLEGIPSKEIKLTPFRKEKLLYKEQGVLSSC